MSIINNTHKTNGGITKLKGMCLIQNCIIKARFLVEDQQLSLGNVFNKVRSIPKVQHW